MKINVPKDIITYEPKFMGQFTKRQIKYIALACCVILPAYFLLYFPTGSVTIAMLGACFVGVPVIFCGFLKKDQLYIDNMMKVKLREISYPKCRKFVMTNNAWDVYQQLAQQLSEGDKNAEQINEDQTQKRKHTKKEKHST